MDNKKEMSGMGRASIWGVIICAPNSWVNSPQETFNFAAELTASPVGGRAQLVQQQNWMSPAGYRPKNLAYSKKRFAGQCSTAIISLLT